MVGSCQGWAAGRHGQVSDQLHGGDLEQHQVVQEGDKLCLLLGSEGLEGGTGACRFTTVCQNGFGEGSGAPIVQIGGRGTHTPEVCGQEHRGTSPDLVDTLGKFRPHVVALQVTKKDHDGMSIVVLLECPQAKHHTAIGLLDLIVSLVIGQVKHNGEGWVDAPSHRILSSREDGVTEVRVLAGLTKERQVDGETWDMAGRTPHLSEDLLSGLNGADLRGGQGRNESKL